MDEQRSVPTLVTDLVQQISALMQTEFRLIRAEISEKLTQAGSGAGEIVAGAICLLAALLILLQAVIVALAEMGLGVGWASLIVGLVLAVIGAVLVKMGTGNLSPSRLMPERTQRQLKRDAQVAKEQVQ